MVKTKSTTTSLPSRALVIGGAGFIGSNLCKLLLKLECKVVCLDNLITGKVSNIESILSNDRFQFIEGDIRDCCVINSLPNDIDYVINLAGIASPKWYAKFPIDTLMTSVLGVYNILQYCVQYKLPLIHASTSEVYGDPIYDELYEEYNGNVSCLGPRACYDEGKRAAETLCRDFTRINDLDVKIIRIFNTYGPFMAHRDGRAIPEFINCALRNEDIVIYGNGNQTRSFQYIDDLLDAIIRLMQCQEKITSPINIGNPYEEYSINDLANIILELTDSKSKIIYHEELLDDPRKRRPNISKAISFLAWEPKVDIIKGLLETINYFQEK